jgi:hypothetical protein
VVGCGSSATTAAGHSRYVHAVEALGGAAEGSYEQEAAVVEEDEETKREDERGEAKRQNHEVDVSERAELRPLRCCILSYFNLI